ncbi:septum formation family protein [Tomitella gaofuii]|uniref:septum formation family protein n=1 Tax=Tomitella gaofuii TaxID=2760083 RepID=UPI0015FA0D2F|nr:septum formation family protein [Tomitella gaofuii]
MSLFRRRRSHPDTAAHDDAAHDDAAHDAVSGDAAARDADAGAAYAWPGGRAHFDEDAELDAPADPAPQHHPHLTAQNMRRSLILVALGSLAAAVITLVSTGNLDSVFGSSEPSVAANAGDAPVKTGSAEGPAFGGAKPGTCLTWQDQQDPEITEVDCAQPHLFEVAQRVDLSDFPSSEFGPHAQVTDAQRYATLRDSVCAPAVGRYLDGRLDPSGRFTVGLIHPGGKGWAQGERTVLCGLQETGVDGASFQPITGTVAGQDQSRVHPPGTCLGIENGLPTDPVDCASEHSVEVTGQVDLAAQFPGGWPPLDKQDEFLGETCRKISEDYVGGEDALHNTTLTVYWSTQSLPSWLAGSRKVDCTVGFGASEGAYAVLTGSAKGGLMIDGKAPEPKPLPPPGRAVAPPLPSAGE